MTSARIITYAEAYSFLRALGVPEDAVKLGDESYALPTREWVARFGAAFSHMVESLGASEWLAQVFDCENHSLRAVCWACDAHRNTFTARKETPNCGIAFGELWLGSRSHALCFAIHALPFGSLSFQAYEPQLTGERHIAMQPVELAPDEFKQVLLAKLQ